MSQRFIPPISQLVKSDASGVASGWKLYFYSTGTTTAKDTFSDAALTTANANPVVADSSGRFGDIFLEAGTYRVILKDSDDATIWDADPVSGSLGSTGAVDEKTAAYTVTVGDASKIIAVDASSAAVTITLLAAATAGDGFEVVIKKTDASSNAVTIDGNGSETIDGSTTYLLHGRYESVWLRSDGSNWQVGSSHRSSKFLGDTTATAAAGPILQLYRNSASPADNDALGQILFDGENDNDELVNYANITAQIVDASDTTEDGGLRVQTMQAGTTTTMLFARLGLFTPNATGGDKGLDSINASAVYDDNTLLTCYVFDQALDGQMDDAKWDGKVPDRVHRDKDGNPTGPVTPTTHEPMRRFRATLGPNGINCDDYGAFWKGNRHLPAMPDETTFDPARNMPTGEWVQRLVETVEVQAVLIDELNQRVKALGG